MEWEVLSRLSDFSFKNRNIKLNGLEVNEAFAHSFYTFQAILVKKERGLPE
jgi:hypothetical protein